MAQNTTQGTKNLKLALKVAITNFMYLDTLGQPEISYMSTMEGLLVPTLSQHHIGDEKKAYFHHLELHVEVHYTYSYNRR